MPGVEALEGRALLSRLGAAGNTTAPAPRALVRAAGHVRRGPAAPVSTHNPLTETVVDGAVVKHPEFYRGYTGPRLASLNGRAATARLVRGGDFAFTGTMVGPIDPAAPAYYVFGVDRGGAKAPGPFAQRSMIFFDAAVVVATGPQGVSGTVILLDRLGRPRSVTPLPAGNVQVEGPTVSVAVAPALLPPTSTPPTRLKLTEYRFALWIRTAPGPDSTIASFVPEYSTAPFHIPRF